MSDQTTEAAVSETPAIVKPRKSRRVATLVVGSWMVGRFTVAKHQPTGTAAREVEALRNWFKKSENIKALLDEGLVNVESVRRELAQAELGVVSVMKAKVQ